MPDDLAGGRFRRRRVLGRGAMGEVWLAEDVLLDRLVAVKSIAAGTGAAPDDDWETYQPVFDQLVEDATVN